MFSLESFCGQSFFFFSYLFGTVYVLIGSVRHKHLARYCPVCWYEQSFSKSVPECTYWSNLAEPVLDVWTLECNMENFSSKINKPLLSPLLALSSNYKSLWSADLLIENKGVFVSLALDLDALVSSLLQRCSMLSGNCWELENHPFLEVLRRVDS